MILTQYTLTAPLNLNLALVADLHEHDPAPLLTLLAQQKPDLICVAGDTFQRQAQGSDPRSKKDYGTLLRLTHALVRGVDDQLQKLKKDTTDPDHAFRFLAEAAALAPVMLSLGNHEWYLTREDRSFLAANGITLLDNSHVLWRGIRIGGLSSGADEAWVKGFAQYPEYKLLLCHHPEFYPRYVRPYPIDLTLSGHAHGGQIRLFGRGLFSTGQGLFPRYHHGVYENRLVVSAGCANTAAIPRWGNPCELVMLRLRRPRQSE